MSDSPKLEKCPFCGETPGKPFQIQKKLGIVYWATICDTCDAEGPSSLGEEEAIAAWNTRAIESALATVPAEPEVVAWLDTCPACGDRKGYFDQYKEGEPTLCGCPFDAYRVIRPLTYAAQEDTDRA